MIQADKPMCKESHVVLQSLENTYPALESSSRLNITVTGLCVEYELFNVSV